MKRFCLEFLMVVALFSSCTKKTDVQSYNEVEVDDTSVEYNVDENTDDSESFSVASYKGAAYPELLTLGDEDYNISSKYDRNLKYEDQLLRKNNTYSFGYIYPITNYEDILLESVFNSVHFFSGEMSSYASTHITYVVRNPKDESIDVEFCFGDSYNYYYESNSHRGTLEGLEKMVLRLDPGFNIFTVSSTTGYFNIRNYDLQGKEVIVNSDKLNWWTLSDDFKFFSEVETYCGGFVYVMDDYDYIPFDGATKFNNCFFIENGGYTNKYFKFSDSKIPSKPMDYIFEFNYAKMNLPNSFAREGSTVALNDGCELLDENGMPDPEESFILSENTLVKIISIGKGDWVNDQLSNWCVVEVVDGPWAGTRATVFGGYFKEIFDFGFDPVLEEVFGESKGHYMTDEAGSVILEWLKDKCNESDIESIIRYINACKKREYFDYLEAPNPLMVTIETKFMKGFDQLIEEFPELVEIEYVTGKYGECIDYPLLSAVKSGNPYYVEVLIDKGADASADVSESLDYGPIRKNLLSVCKNEEIEQLLLVNGAKPSYEVKLNCKLKTLEGNIVRLYSEASESSSYVEFELTEENNDFNTVEIGYYNYPYDGSRMMDYVCISRWVKITGNGVTGWVKPNEIFMPFGYFEP